MQLPWVTAPENRTPDILGSIGNSLVAAAQRKQEQQRFMASQLRQRKLDDEAAKLHAAQIANYESEAAQRQAEAERKSQLDHLAAVKDIQASLDAGKIDEAKLKAAAYKVKLDQVAASVTQQPGNTVMPPTSVDLTAEPKPGESTTDVMDRNQAAIAANQPLAPKPPTAFNIGGQTYDPAQTEAAQQAEREKTAQRVGAAYEPLGYGKQASALALGDTGKAADIDALIAQRMKADQSDKERRDLLSMRLDATSAQHERENLTVEQKLSEAAKNRAAKIESMRQLGGPRQDQSNLQAYKYVDQVTKDGAKELGLPKLNETLNLFDIAQQELKKESGAAQIGARMVAERALRGGPPTQYMDQQEATHLGGLWARFTGAIQTAANGQLGDEQRHAISEEIDAARQQYIVARDRRLAAIRGRLERDPALQNMRGSVNERYRQTAEGMGAKGDDIFPGAENELPPVGAGSVSSKPKAKPTVREALTGAGKKKTGEDPEARKKRLLQELSGG